MRVGWAAAEGIDEWIGVPANTMKVAVVQQYSYSSSPQKSDRQSKAIIAALMVFMLLGFLAGLALLAIRNAYLFN